MTAIGKILRHPALHAVAAFVLFTAAYVLTGIAATGYKPLRNSPLQVLIVVVCVGLTVVLYKWFQRRIEQREDVELALPGAEREVSAGFVGGLVLFSAMVGVTALLGGLEVDGVRGMGRLWTMIAMGIATGFFEELLFRGILFRQVERVGGSWGALAVTSAFFGLAHIMNPGATWFAAVAIAFEAGILLGGAYMLTRRLWLAIGLHAGWNFTQGWIFSVPVSGGKAPEGLLIVQRHGPDWLTGGAFGLEASAVAMVVATSAGCVLLWLAWRRGQFVVPMWRRQEKS